MKTNSTHLTLALFFCVFVQAMAFSGPNAFNVSKGEAEKIKAKVNSGEFSLSSFAFVENKGQVYGYDGLPHPEVKFSFQQGNTQIFLLENGIAYQFTKMHYPDGYQEMPLDKGGKQDFEKMLELKKQIRTETFRMDMTLVGANNHVEITTEGRSADYTNFYNRNVLDVHSFNKVTYHNVYPGIDWVIYIKNNQIKYDFKVKPGADPTLIKMQFHHQENLALNKDGSFTLKNSLGSISEKAPVSFQGLFKIETKFKLKENIISFVLENYNSKETLVIDPALVWATYYGGILGEAVFFCDNDALGNIYLAGQTNSSSGSSIAQGGHQNTYGGGSYDAFLVKFNSSGVRQWGSYYGGSDDDSGYSCATDALGNVYLAGYTHSSSGIASGGHQNSFGNNGFYCAYLVKFNSSGVRQWGTYYVGVNGHNRGYTCATDAAGNVYLAGRTESNIGISLGGHQNAFGGFTDAFLVKFNASGVMQWGTYYGGSGSEIGHSCSTDAFGNVYLAGQTSSPFGISLGGHQNAIGSNFNSDAFLVKFNSSGIRQWGTYYGGAGPDIGYSCASDVAGNVYLAGETLSTNDIGSGGHQNSFGGGFQRDAFLVKFNASGVRQWGTYYGGTGHEVSYSCKSDASGNVFLAGYTESSNGTIIASAGSHQTNFGGGSNDAFIAKFNSAGIRLWGSYFGGSGGDHGRSCSIDAFGKVYLAGNTISNYLATLGSHQNQIGGNTDAFLVKFCETPSQPSVISGNTVVCFGSAQNYSVTNDTFATAYSWNFSGFNWSGTSTANIVSVLAGLSGSLTVAAVNACGVGPTSTLAIVSNTLPIVIVNSGTICSGQSFTIVPSGASTYTIQGANSVVSPNTSTSYTVSGSSSDGCLSANTATANVLVNSLPVISISAVSTVICVGESIDLLASGADSYTWSPLAFSSSITVTPSITTVYSVVGQDANACENTSAFILQVDECTGIANTSKSETAIQVYPNPNKGLLNIELPYDAKLIILNTLGQIVYSSMFNAGQHQMNLEQLANGMYVLKIQNGPSSKYFNLIKE